MAGYTTGSRAHVEKAHEKPDLPYIHAALYHDAPSSGNANPLADQDRPVHYKHLASAASTSQANPRQLEMDGAQRTGWGQSLPMYDHSRALKLAPPHVEAGDAEP